MASRLSQYLYTLVSASFLFNLCHASVVRYDWNITWTTANPDNAMERPVMGINGKWPLPTVNITKGDRLIVNVHNQLGDQATSIHWHGFYQKDSPNMDGAVGASQCVIDPEASFTYDFVVRQSGTYWYHAHVLGSSYPDGLRGPLIVNDPDGPFKGQYDEEVLMSLGDWYHDQMPALTANFMSVTNPTGAEPVPDAAIMNDGQHDMYRVEPGKTYLFRVVNMGAFASHYLWFEGHKMKVVEVDGVWTEPMDAEMLYITVAQRYSFLITARNDKDRNYAIVGSMDQDLFDAVPPTLNPNVTGWLVYDDKKPLPEPALIDSFGATLDDYTLVPHDRQELLGEPDQQIVLDMKMDNLGDGVNYAFFNDVTYVSPKVPSIYTALSTGSMATNPAVYGVNANAFVLDYGQTIEIVLNNLDAGKHPFHLHGHDFQVVARSEEDAGIYNHNVTFPSIPMRRDTIYAKPNGNFVIRYRSDNPGVWLFHCHILFHFIGGLAATIVEAPLELQNTLKIPENHYQACREADTPYLGNAAGRTEDLLNLDGALVSPDPLPEGFTGKGVVALTFSILSALLGLGSIIWYGSAPLTSKVAMQAKERIEKAGAVAS